MKILIITPWYPNERNPISGIFIKEYVSAISEHCNVVVFHTYPDKIKRIVKTNKHTNDSVTYIQFSYPNIPLISTFISIIASTIWILKNWDTTKPDIIHGHELHGGLIGIILKKIKKIPIIMTEHVEIKFENKHNLKQILKNLLLKYTLAKADFLLLPSIYMCKQIKSIGIHKNCKKFYNVVDTELFTPKNNNHGSKKQILFLGRLSEEKGVRYLLYAVAEMRYFKKRKDFHVHIIGTGPEIDTYRSLATELEISDLITFHGMKNKKYIAEFIKKCDVLVLPSLMESFGVVLIEGLAAGVPVITTSCGGQKEIIIHKKLGKLIPPKNVKALVEAMDDILDNTLKYPPKLLSDYVNRKYSYNAVGIRMVETYKEIIHDINKNTGDKE